MDSPGEILNLCRLCLVKDQVNIPIFEEQGDIRQIFLKISSCLPVTITRHDQLPKRICDACSNKLDLLYEFWNSSASAEKTLLSWLGQAGVEDAGEKISAVAQQIAKPAETLVKEESEALDESNLINESRDSFEDQSIDDEGTKDEAEAPPPKRARRTAAVKAQINITPESDEDEDDDFDAGEAMTKMEDESEESESDMKDDPSYSELPGTSADDQAGPSGVGKDGVEAPITKASGDDDGLEIFTSCFISLVDVLKHPNTVDSKQEGRKKYSCYICFEKFCTNEGLNQHKTQHDNDDDTDEDPERIEENRTNDFEVPKAEDSQEHNDAHLKPINLDNPEANFGCLACNVTFQNQSDIKAHFHNTNKCKYLCKICKRYFSMKGGFMVHILKHTAVSLPVPSSSSSQEIGKLPYKCKQCDESFDERSDLMRHHVTAHSIAHNPIESDFQDVQLNNYRADPSNPMTGTFPIYDCGICYDVFASEKALIRHQEMHKQIALIPKVEPSDASSEDLNVKVVQKDCQLTAHDIISNFTLAPAPVKTKAPHPKKAPLRSIAPQDCIENRASPPLHFVKNPSKPVEKVTRTNSAKNLVPKDSVLNPVAANQGLQFMNVTNPGLTTTQASLPQTGQSYILINPNNYAVGSVNPAINCMNPIPHLIPHGSATAVTSMNSVTNPNLLVNSDGNPVSQATFINSLNEFSTIEPGKPLYFLVPANQQAAEKQNSAVASTSITGGSSCSWIPKLAPVSDKRTNRNRPKRRFNENPANNPNMEMPFSNVGSTIQISDDDDVNSLQDNSDIIMPIITSFGTVLDDCGHKKPKTTEPATEYENEFQKFLKDGLNKNKVVCLGPPPRPKISMPKVDATEIATASQTGDPLAHVGVSRKSLAEVKEPTNPAVVPISPATDPLSCDQPSSSANGDIIKPKIFVKKLTDLIDASKKPSETGMPDLFCVLCNQFFFRWLNFKNHMEQQHHKFSCKFFKCEMFDDVQKLIDHMQNHKCLYCKGEYRKLSGHVELCRFHPNFVAKRSHSDAEQIVTYEVD